MRLTQLLTPKRTFHDQYQLCCHNFIKNDVILTFDLTWGFQSQLFFFNSWFWRLHAKWPLFSLMLTDLENWTYPDVHCATILLLYNIVCVLIAIHAPYGLSLGKFINSVTQNDAYMGWIPMENAHSYTIRLYT